MVDPPPSATPLRIVVAPDKFKGTLSADEVAGAMRAGVESVPGAIAVPLAVADGGDGSVDAALRAGWSPLAVAAADWRGTPIETQVAIHQGRAIIEVATICGLGARRPTPGEALTATTVGVGLAIMELVDQGFDDITIALGGSCTTDGGVGMLIALGLGAYGSDGNPLPLGGGALNDLDAVSWATLDERLERVRLTMACDVDNVLTGQRGAAAVFAPQKGADAAAVTILERGLRRAAQVLEAASNSPGASQRPGSGAAGGLAFAGVLVGASMRSGAEVFLTMSDAAEAIAGADLVITGEGCLDQQSLRGKAPGAVAALAQGQGVPVAAIVGTTTLAPPESTAIADPIIALDRIDPHCAWDPDLSLRLIQGAAAQLTRHLHTSTDLQIQDT